MQILTIQQGDSATIAVILPSERMDNVEDIVCYVGTLKYSLNEQTLSTTNDPNIFHVKLSSSQTQKNVGKLEFTCAIDYTDLGIRKTRRDDLIVNVLVNPNSFTNDSVSEVIGASISVTVSENIVDSTSEVASLIKGEKGDKGDQGIQGVKGDTGSIDITLLDNKVDKVTGKGLSTNDYTTAEKTKLGGIATGSTANDTDANLKNRANHTGTQAVSTIDGLQQAIDSKIDFLVFSKFSTIPTQTHSTYKLILVLADETNGNSPTIYLFDGIGLHWIPTSKLY